MKFFNGQILKVLVKRESEDIEVEGVVWDFGDTWFLLNDKLSIGKANDSIEHWVTDYMYGVWHHELEKYLNHAISLAYVWNGILFEYLEILEYSQPDDHKYIMFLHWHTDYEEYEGDGWYVNTEIHKYKTKKELSEAKKKYKEECNAMEHPKRIRYVYLHEGIGTDNLVFACKSDWDI